MSLSDTKIKSSKPAEKQYKIFDSDGLYMIVTPAGGKWWRFKYVFGSREKSLSLGTYPAISLKLARKKRDEARELIAQGIDPASERKAAKNEKKILEVETGNTFEKIALEWWQKNRNGWTSDHAETVKRRLVKYVFPKIGNNPIATLERPDFVSVLQPLEDQGILETARRVGQIIGQITRFAMDSGLIKYDFGTGLGALVKTGRENHFAAIIDPSEFGQLLVDIENYNGEPSICYALRILPYVFVRSGELRGAKWSEINFDKAEWIIPAERMKKRRPHIVPLAPQVLKLFDEGRKYSGNSDLVFPSTMSKTRCISDVGLLNALRRMGYARDKMCIHGFRASASTLLNEMGYRADLIEAQLAHAETNSVRAAYNKAQWIPERRKMMCEWADYLDELREQAG